MEVCKTFSYLILGITAELIIIETTVSSGLPQFNLIGLADASIRESRERIKPALQNSGYQFPSGRVTVNLAPASLKKAGPQFDLAIALALLASSEQLEPKAIRNTVLVGELSLDGRVRPVRGALPMAIGASSAGFERILLAHENASEAALGSSIPVFGVHSLQEAADFLSGQRRLRPCIVKWEDIQASHESADSDFAEVSGQAYVKRALEIAAAGNHNALLIGAPGAGKTMMARRLPGILPPISRNEALEVTRIHSAAGLLSATHPVIKERPFRSPHHSSTLAGVLGSAQHNRPGEVSLSHRGVLFLDELPEFHRDVLEALREPIEEGYVRLSRAHGTLHYPARFMLITAMNPCPCVTQSKPAGTKSLLSPSSLN